MRPVHSASSLTATPPSRASFAPTGGAAQFCARHKSLVGVSLLAMRPVHSASSLTATPPSRASFAPTGGAAQFCARHKPPVGAEPARDEAGTFSIFVDCHTAIASKLCSYSGWVVAVSRDGLAC
ncbi:hypothetical protein [Pseudomonas prosekii]|uniref:hypothetical protein n=1 Tax=Pseudomonas prosekii TaxID=1148509 RepID=UPI003F914CF2